MALSAAISEANLETPRDVALARMRLLGERQDLSSNKATTASSPSPEGTHKLEREALDNQDMYVGMAALGFPYVRDAAARWLAMAKKWDEVGLRPPCSMGMATNEEKKDEAVLRANDLNDSTDSCCWPLLRDQKETRCLSTALHYYLRLVQLDDTLAEEMARSGCHAILSRLLRFELPCSQEREAQDDDQDVVMELQDLSCEIASHSAGSFPTKTAPFSLEELRQRLPIPFSFAPPNAPSFAKGNTLQQKLAPTENEYLVLIRQVTGRRQSAQDDVGFVMWPSAVVLSSWLLSNPEFVPRTGTVLELGAGCGLVGLVAALMVKRAAQNGRTINDDATDRKCAPTKVSTEVILTDFNAVVLDNLQRNVVLNSVEGIATTAKLNFYLQNGDNHGGGWKETRIHETTREDVLVERTAVDLVLAADVICKRSDATAVVNSIYDSLRPGGNAVVVSAGSRHRYGVEALEEESQRVGLVIAAKVDDVLTAQTSSPSEAPLSSYSQPQHQKSFLSPEQQQPLLSNTTGYVDDMKLSLYRFVKPENAGT